MTNIVFNYYPYSSYITLTEFLVIVSPKPQQRRAAQEASRRESERQATLRRQNEEARLREIMQRQQANQPQNQPSGPPITMTHPLGGVHGRTTFTNPNLVQGYLAQGWKIGY